MASLPSSPSTTLHYKACTKHFPVVLCTTKLAQSTSQYYVVLQSLHKALPSTTLYYKACTKHFPVLLCTTKLAQATSQYYCVLQSFAKSISQYYFVQQSLQKVFRSTLYYKVAQSTSQYYFVVQSLHKARSITTLLWQPMPMLMAPWSFRRRSGKTVFSDLIMAVCWDFWSEINSIWSIFVVLRLCCPVVGTVTRKGNIRIYIYIAFVWFMNPMCYNLESPLSNRQVSPCLLIGPRILAQNHVKSQSSMPDSWFYWLYRHSRCVHTYIYIYMYIYIYIYIYLFSAKTLISWDVMGNSM